MIRDFPVVKGFSIPPIKLYRRNSKPCPEKNSMRRYQGSLSQVLGRTVKTTEFLNDQDLSSFLKRISFVLVL